MVDKSNMRQIILDFPKQFRVGLNAAKNIYPTPDILHLTSIVVCGMGGSALPGELLKLLNANYFHAPIGIHIHRNYGLPYYIEIKNQPRTTKGFGVALHPLVVQGKILNPKPLIICISYSGNTEETLSAYREAVKKKLPVISITSGGKLAKLSKKYRTPIAIIPSGIQPRSALGYQFAALIKILDSHHLFHRCGSDNLLALEKTLKPESLESQGKKLAKKLVGKIPLIYASQNYKALAYFWKIKFNENSKIHAFWNYFPELNHNELVGYTKIKNQKSKIKNFYVIIIRDQNDHPKIIKRMQLTADIIKKSGVEVEFINLEGKNIFEKVFSNYLLGDWVSYYLALKYKIDPTPIEVVEEFKKELKNKKSQHH